ncbi:hypothetical protein ABZP36_010238 [Zizania latifolia]
MANQKRQWYQIHSKERDHNQYKEPTTLFEQDQLVSLTQARIDMSELDEDSDGFLQPHFLMNMYAGAKLEVATLWKISVWERMKFIRRVDLHTEYVEQKYSLVSYMIIRAVS